MGFVRAAESSLLRVLLLPVAKPADGLTVWIGTGDWPFVLGKQETALWTFRAQSLVVARTLGRSLIANPDEMETRLSFIGATPLRIVGLVMFFAVSAFAQVPSSAATAACGPEKVSFKVKLDESQHTVAQPEPGKAWVYFIQQKGKDALGVTTNVGLDGTWVGANKNSSYFAVSVGPGEHHVCASVQSNRGHPVGLVHFTAEAGKVYYFNARIVYGEEAGANLFFGEVDSDQAKYLIAAFPLSVSDTKK